MFPHIFDGSGSGFSYSSLICSLSGPAGVKSMFYLKNIRVQIVKRILAFVLAKAITLYDVFGSFCIYSAASGEESGHLADKPEIVIIRNEWMVKLHIIIVEVVSHILVDYFRICRHHRTVIVIRRSAVFDSFVVDRRIEYPLYAILNQPFDVSVYYLCRIACCV